ncbi:MAG: TIGR02186 family protein [Litoreibacter sp.]
MRILLSLLVVVCCFSSATAEEVVAALSRDQVSITTTFDGSDLFIYGAVKRDAPMDDQTPLEVIVTVSWPSEPVSIRKKDRRFGIWVNTENVDFAGAPSFYAVVTSAPLSEILSPAADQRHRITTARAIKSLYFEQDEFSEALLRIRKNNGLYVRHEGAVQVREQTLFSTELALPANLVEGDYLAKFFLTRNGEVVDVHTQTIPVKKVGLERWIYNLAHDKPLIYGLFSLFIAVSAGWTASAFFRYLRF